MYTTGNSETMIALVNRMGNEDFQAPPTYNQAMNSADCGKWKEEMDEEIIQVSTET